MSQCCPHCAAELTEAQIKSIWARYTASKRKDKPFTPWKQHSEKAAARNRCLCAACHRARELQSEVVKPPVAKSERDLERDAILDEFGVKAYEALVRREAAQLKAKQKSKLSAKVNSERYNFKLNHQKQAASLEGKLDHVRRAAEKLADATR